jgi:hypothetical protein
VNLGRNEVKSLVKGSSAGAASTFFDTLKAADEVSDVSEVGDSNRQRLMIRGIPTSVTPADLLGRLRLHLNLQDIKLLEFQKGNAPGAPQWTNALVPKTYQLQREFTIYFGWSPVTVSRWIRVPTCSKCNIVGHKLAQCRPASDVCSRRCQRCGDLTHDAHTCEAPRRCYMCGTHGHSANQAACPYFRECLSALRNGQPVPCRTPKALRSGEATSRDPNGRNKRVPTRRVREQQNPPREETATASGATGVPTSPQQKPAKKKKTDAAAVSGGASEAMVIDDSTNHGSSDTPTQLQSCRGGLGPVRSAVSSAQLRFDANQRPVSGLVDGATAPSAPPPFSPTVRDHHVSFSSRGQ